MRVLMTPITMAALLLVSTVRAEDSESTSGDELELEIFVAEPDEINVTSPLIMGPTEMMVVSAQATKSSANRLADAIEQKGLEVKFVFLTHPHLDHSQGAGILLERFPDAKFIASPEVAKLQRHRMQMDDDLAESRYGDNAAIPSIPAEEYAAPEIEIDGHTIEIWKDIVGDAGLGHPDEPHVALYIPSLDALIPSDVVYYAGHVMMGGSTPQSRAKWVEQLNGWIERNPKVVVPGHMPKTKRGELTAQGALVHTRDYILAYDKAMAEGKTSDDVIEKMLALYPRLEHQSALYLGTYINFKDMHRLTFNPTIEKIASYLPDSWVRWLNEKIFDSKKKEANFEVE